MGKTYIVGKVYLEAFFPNYDYLDWEEDDREVTCYPGILYV